MTKGYLDKVYDAVTTDEVTALYAAWADSYDAEVSRHGYATPLRCAQALKAAGADPTQAVLDFGCGTGMSGKALRAEGFTVIDGVDLSAEMLAQARASAAYRDLTQIDAGAPLPFAAGTYTAISAIGVIGAGAAPVSVLDDLMQALPKAGLMVFSFNDHTLEDPAFMTAVDAWTETGRARMVHSSYGDHLPGIGLKSTVIVLEKT